jgi:hypothetical protein
MTGVAALIQTLAWACRIGGSDLSLISKLFKLGHRDRGTVTPGQRGILARGEGLRGGGSG